MYKYPRPTPQSGALSFETGCETREPASNGRKHNLMVDALGLILAVVIAGACLALGPRHWSPALVIACRPKGQA